MSSKNTFDGMITDKDKRVIFALFAVAIFVAMGLFTAIIFDKKDRLTVYSFQDCREMLELNKDVTPYYSIDDVTSTAHTVTPPTMTELGGIWNDWRDGIRNIWWQDGTFRVNKMKLLPRSAGKVGGTVTEILVYTNLPSASMTNVYVNEGFYFTLFKFNGIFPYPVDAKAYSPKSSGWSSFGTGDLRFKNTNLKFAVDGVYIMAVHLELTRVTQGGMIHEEVDFFTDPFYIGSSGGSSTNPVYKKVTDFFSKVV